MTKGKLIILCGPSGSGKTTVARHLLKEVPTLSFSISATTRKPRTHEQDGVDYHFLTVEDFKSRLAKQEFLEYEEVYEGLLYGTLSWELERIWGLNKVPVLDIDVLGALNVKGMMPEAMAIFVHPVSIENVRHRLEMRATESPESFEKRVKRAEEELAMAERFDKIVMNDELGHALKQAEEYINEYLDKE